MLFQPGNYLGDQARKLVSREESKLEIPAREETQKAYCLVFIFSDT
jgi:hypothetical protein